MGETVNRLNEIILNYAKVFLKNETSLVFFITFAQNLPIQYHLYKNLEYVASKLHIDWTSPKTLSHLF